MAKAIKSSVFKAQIWTMTGIYVGINDMYPSYFLFHRGICKRKLNVTMIFRKEEYDNWPDQQPCCNLVGPTRFYMLNSTSFFIAKAISKRMPFFVCYAVDGQ